MNGLSFGSTGNFHLPDTDMARMENLIRAMQYSGQQENGSQKIKLLQQIAEHIEPLYDTFFCPLTKKIMDDPVTIESGVTYEREAIAKWFQRFEGSSDDIVCPTTGRKLEIQVMNTNLALRTTIKEWKKRNEVTRIKVAYVALSLANSRRLVLEAMKDLQHLCKRKTCNSLHVYSMGILQLLAQFIEYEVKEVRCEALRTLTILVEEEEGKEIIANTDSIDIAVRLLSTDDPSEQEATILFLLEISKSITISQKIGSVTGAILMLTTMKHKKSVEASIIDKVATILRNLEKCPSNIQCMAEIGLVEPLLNNLVNGTEENKREMASLLGIIILGHDNKKYIANRASATLIKMVQTRDPPTQNAALRALTQISSHAPNGKTLVEAGIVPVMIEEMFAQRTHSESLASKGQPSIILANILDAGLDPDMLQVNAHGHTMASDYTTYNFVDMLKHTTPDELNTNIIRILLSLMNFQKPEVSIVKAVRDTEASHTVAEFLNSPSEELSTASAKLLIKLSPHMGNTVAERLCKIDGQPEGLIENLEVSRITEKQTVSAELLAKLPWQNLMLNRALLRSGTVPIILHNIHEIQSGETRGSRYARAYLEWLVGILVRFTTTLYDVEVLQSAKDHDLTSVFTWLLARTSSDEVQRLSAIALQNLSSETMRLSKPPVPVKKPRKDRFLPRCFSARSAEERNPELCPVHRGTCSPSATFCLLESRAVERLLGCLDHENSDVAETALSAICTLLDDTVDVNKSLSLLSEVGAVQTVLDVFKEHQEEGLRQKSLWVIEKFLIRGGAMYINDISSDKALPAALVSALHHGDSSTKKMAENILRYLKRIPNASRNATALA